MARARTKKPRTHRTASAAEANVVSATSNRWITAGVLALYLAGSVVSFFGLYGIAPWLKVPEQAWVFVVIFIDLGIIVYKFAEIRLRLDPRKQHLAYKAKSGVLISTIVSSAANCFHVIQSADPDPIKFWAGAGVAALAPWFIYLAGLVLTDVVVKPKPRRRDDVSRETFNVFVDPDLLKQLGESTINASVPALVKQHLEMFPPPVKLTWRQKRALKAEQDAAALPSATLILSENGVERSTFTAEELRSTGIPVDEPFEPLPEGAVEVEMKPGDSVQFDANTTVTVSDDGDLSLDRHAAEQTDALQTAQGDNPVEDHGFEKVSTVDVAPRGEGVHGIKGW